MGWRKNVEIAKGAALGGGVCGALGWIGKVAGVAGGIAAGPLGWGVALASAWGVLKGAQEGAKRGDAIEAARH